MSISMRRQWRRLVVTEQSVWSADYRELIARSDVDIVIIATYAQSHLAILKDCLKAGKHVLCEKPMVAREEELEEFLLAVRNARTKVLIAHVLRHNDSYRRLHDMIADGMIGEPRVLRMVQNHHHMGQHRLTALLEDCSPVVDCGVHYIDVARWFTGQEVQSIAGIGSRISVPEDAPHFDLRHAYHADERRRSRLLRGRLGKNDCVSEPEGVYWNEGKNSLYTAV